MSQLITDIFTGFFQEAVLLTSIIVYVIVSLFWSRYFYKASKWFAVFVVILTMISVLKVQVIPNFYGFNGSLLSNLYVVFIKTLILAGTFFVILLSKNIVLKKRLKAFNYFSLVLISTLGALLLVSSNDYLTVFLSIGLMNIPIIFLIRAKLRYILTYIISSLIFISGVILIFKSIGAINFDVIYSLLTQTGINSAYFNVGCVLCALGLTFNMGLVPFSSWLPDIFGSTYKNVSSYISIVPIFAGLGVTSRIIVFMFQYTPMVQALLFIIGIFSVYKGFLGAMRQEKLSKFMGYSTIAQSGFMIFGFCLATPYSVSASLFYMISYIFMNIGVWAAIILFNNVTHNNLISDLKGLVYSSKSFSLVLGICLLSLAGLPVTAGFFAKLYLFTAMSKFMDLYLVFLAIVMVACVLGVYVYFRPIKEMFYVAENVFYKSTKFYSLKIALYISAIVTILICIFPNILIQICQSISYRL